MEKQKVDGTLLHHKLHPRRFPGMSPKMAAMVGYILGQEWTSPSLITLSITSDGFLVSMEHFLGSATDLEDNLTRLFKAANLSREEQEYFWSLFRQRVDDWRRERI